MGVAFLQKALGRTDDVVTSVVDDIERAVKRADTVIRGLLDFASFKQLNLTTENLNTAVNQALMLVRHECTKAKVDVVHELAEGLPPVAIDRNKIEQVLINAFVNACHAMPSGGTLTVRTRAQSLAERGNGIGHRTEDAFNIGETAVVLEVDDSGTGIPEDKLSKVFDPFFTTKLPGQGTGLGLSVCKSIIEMHKGLISIGNRPEGGARLRVLLHAADADPAASATR